MNDGNDGMAAGELEMRKAFEEVTTRNVKTISAFSQETREIVRKLEEEVKKQNKLLSQYDQKFADIKQQIVVLQAKLYSGGS